jgi:acyl-CoA thioesterase-1
MHQRRPGEVRRLIVGWSIGVAATLAVTAAVLWLVSPPQESFVASTSGTTFTPFPTASHKPPLALPANPRVLFFGDSFTEGWGATPETEGYAYKIGPLMGWQVTVDGVGSTGFLSPGNKQQGTYQQRIEAEKYGDDFDLVVLQGGSNDQNVAGDFTGALDSTVKAIHLKYPRAQLLILGPVNLGTVANANKVSLNEKMRDYAAANDIWFVNPIAQTWFPDSSRKLDENMTLFHPNAAGYAVMAAKLSDDLREITTTG